jgi:esterase/lipase
MSDPQLQSRHQPSGFNSRFAGGQLPFADYVSNTRTMLGQAHAKHGSSSIEEIVEGNAPFELQPAIENHSEQTKKYRHGILLVHGLTDSPYFMRYLAEFYRQQGFLARVILLPGHGTQPGDLLEVTWQEWFNAVQYGIDELDKEADEIYLAGLSAGGALSLYQSLVDVRIRGLFLFSPALGITPRAAFASWHKGYSWLVPSAKWVDIKPDTDSYKYESLTKNAVAQLYDLLKNLDARLRSHRVDIPVFAAASAQDVTVNFAATQRFMRNATHPRNKLVVYARERSAQFDDAKIEWVSSALPEQRILDFSHLSIVLPPEDAHYGSAGDYANCIHYYPGEMEKYRVCLTQPQQVLLGEITEQNLRAGIVRRLTYNPYFEQLKASMNQFIGGLRADYLHSTYSEYARRGMIRMDCGECMGGGK